MKMTVEEINEAIVSGRIRALSLDTSAIDKQGRRLESGLLLQLGQFRDAESTLVLSDIVEQESIAHLTKAATDARADLIKGLKSVCGPWAVPEARTGNTHSGIEIDRVEVLPYKGYAHLGEVEPDWMNDPDNSD